MTAYLDVMFSIVLGSLLLLMILAYNFDMVDQNIINNMYLNVQSTGIGFQEILKYDLKKIGLGVPDTTVAFIIADSNQIKFKADIDLDGSINEIHYYAGDLNSADFTENPNDMLLYHRVDDNPYGFSIAVTGIRFNYYDKDGNETATLADIRHIGYSFYLESTFGYNGEFPGIYIRGRIKPKNIGLN